MIIDAFPFFDEFDMLECRLTEIGDAVDVVLAVEADLTHQGQPKPYHLTENLDRFERWWDKLVVVRAELPTLEESGDPWKRERAQREWISAIDDLPGLSGSDIVLQSDVDEIPRRLQTLNVRPGGGLVVFQNRFHPFAVDWLHPMPWKGTVAGTVDSIRQLGDQPFARMRDSRLWGPVPPGFDDAGWHFSWVGADPMSKATAFAHPEVTNRVADGGDRFRSEGVHVDGERLRPVDVDSSWPRWVQDGNAPQSWYRPR